MHRALPCLRNVLAQVGKQRAADRFPTETLDSMRFVQVSTHTPVNGQTVTYVRSGFIFYLYTILLSSPFIFFCHLPGRHSDPASQCRGFSPPPHTSVDALHFYDEDKGSALSSRVDSCRIVIVGRRLVVIGSVDPTSYQFLVCTAVPGIYIYLTWYQIL